MNPKMESRLQGEVSTTLGRQISKISLLMAESEEEPKSLLMRVKEKNENATLKLSIQNTKIMGSDSSNSWQKEAEKVEAVTDFIFLGP